MQPPVIGALGDSIVAALPEGAWAFDARLRVAAWNPAMERVTGLPFRSVAGRAVSSLFPRLATRAESRAMRLALGGRACATEERPFAVSPRDRRGWYRTRYAPLRDAGGRVIGGLGVVADLTQHRDEKDSLRLLLEIGDAAALAQAGDDALLAACAERICRLKGWAAARVWQPGADGTLVCAPKASWAVASLSSWRRASAAAPLGRRQGLAGRSWARGAPVWRDDSPPWQDEPVHRADAKAGLSAGFALPVFRLGRPFAVLEFLDRRELGFRARSVAWSWALSRHLGRVFERRLVASGLAARERLERRALELELSENLGQVLAGGALLAKTLADDLGASRSPHLARAAELAGLVARATAHARRLAGISPAEAGGLVPALCRLAREVEERHKIVCDIDARGTEGPEAAAAGTHLFRIAEEAVLNAVTHGQARRVAVQVAFQPRVDLTVRSDGAVLPARLRRGMGLAIMHHRSNAIGARLRLSALRGGGALLRCTMAARRRAGLHER